MEYTIEGGNLPIVRIAMERGEAVKCESGAMAWMDDGIVMETKSGGFGKAFGRLFSGESIFLNEYHAQRAGEIVFTTSLPGNIMAIEVWPDKPVIMQKGAFLASTPGVELSVYLQKKLGSGFFGGEGFVMQKAEGSGTLFLEIDGSAHEYYLQPGERKIIDTGYLAMMDGTCRMDVEQVKGVKNMLFGGEGMFNTVVTGPGRIILQSMPVSSFAMMIYSHIPHPSN